MPQFRFTVLLPSTNGALRSPHAFATSIMLSRVVNHHTSSKGSQPLNPAFTSANISRPLESNKRKFERSLSTTSGLGALHQQVYFDENDFDDVIDLTTPPKKVEIKYPDLKEVQYLKLPSVSPSPRDITSSAPVPWSSSPPSHFEQPVQLKAPVPEDDEPPAKRKSLPWAKNGYDTKWRPSKQAKDRVYQPSSEKNGIPLTPVPERSEQSQYQWDKSASVVKDEQKELRKRNKSKSQATKVEILPRPVTSVPTTMLSREQKNVVKAVIDQGKSVFFTGSAGTGKSVLMRAIISRFRDKFRREPDRLAVTASTGLAACVIEGTTLHSWAGIGLGKEPAPELVRKIKRNAKTKAKWQRTKVLVIDEISMVDGDLFDKLEQVARAVRNNGRPFGGIQIVVTGDFFQLPPVPERNSVAKFAFDAATWNTCIEHTILLTHVFRQKDPAFAKMLNEMRLGQLSASSVEAFKKLTRSLEFEDEIDATELFPTRSEVDNANNVKMQMLSGQTMTFKAVDSGIADEKAREKVLQNFMAPEMLSLKKGAQVMLIKNMDTQLVNGSLGKVHSFMDESTFYVYKDDEHLFLQAHDDGAGNEDAKAIAKKKLEAIRAKNGADASIQRLWPMVRFALPDGTSRDMLCLPEEWKTENQKGEIIAKRSQVPLILSWALSIHKAQGQTLNRVKVDLGRVFERGQAYVALSRATSQAGLQVLRFDQRKVMVHPKVIQFYAKLVSSETLGGKKNHPKDEQDALTVDDDEEEEEIHEYMYA